MGSFKEGRTKTRQAQGARPLCQEPLVIAPSSLNTSGMTVQKIIRKNNQWFLIMLGMPLATVNHS
ncbi:hypothetical protein COV18_01680 [Candidatus Woesearchaeota archaeon CG10_big_fil_rev_8_21_14_0_10_37_12]|nr:MAG: hypothetical protein COV18_01680 [Candidatus Woesearchaeota archaeon CG10_big_fil_rev_8_21_14_0_10_37_12]